MPATSLDEYMNLLHARPLSLAERRWIGQSLAQATGQSVRAINQRLLQRCDSMAAMALLARANRVRAGAELDGKETECPRDHDVMSAVRAIGAHIRGSSRAAATPLAMTLIRELKCPLPL